MNFPSGSTIFLGCKAVTLVELLLSLVLLGVLAGILMPAVNALLASSTDVTSAHAIAQLNAASRSYLGENNMTFWPYKTRTNGGTQWWFGFETAESLSAPEGKRWLDLSRGPLGPYIASSGGMRPDPSFARAGNAFKPNNGKTHFAYGYNLLLEGKRMLSLGQPSKIPVFATCAQVNTFQAPASQKKPMIEEFYYFNATERTVHFRIGGHAMVGYADGSAGYLPMMPGTLDPKLPTANIGRLDPRLITPSLIDSGE